MRIIEVIKACCDICWVNFVRVGEDSTVNSMKIEDSIFTAAQYIQRWYFHSKKTGFRIAMVLPNGVELETYIMSMDIVEIKEKRLWIYLCDNKY